MTTPNARYTNAPDTLWYTRCAVPTPLGIAARLGWLDAEFAADGIGIKVVVESEQNAQRESHYDHSLENSFRLGGSIPAIWARASGRDTRLLGLTWTDEFQAIVALSESGIKTARDLRGRRIGIPRHDSEYIDHGRASALRGALTALELGGLGVADVELVDLIEPRNSIAEQGSKQLAGSVFEVPCRGSGNRALRELLQGGVDAIYLKGPKGLELAYQIGAHVVVDIGAHPDPLVRANNCTPRTFTVSGALFDQHPDLVRRLAARVVAAGDWAAAHPAEAVRYIGLETSTADKWVTYAYGRDVHRHLYTDLREESVAALSHLVDFLHQWNFLPAPVDVRRWIDGPLRIEQNTPVRLGATA